MAMNQPMMGEEEGSNRSGGSDHVVILWNSVYDSQAFQSSFVVTSRVPGWMYRGRRRLAPGKRGPHFQSPFLSGS